MVTDNMSIKCRLCGAVLTGAPVFELNNMPKSAQFFPDESELETEKGIDIILYQCDGCGHVQASGAPVSYYKDVIRATAVSGEMKEFRTRQFREFVEAHGLSGKKIIEIGAAFGDYLAIMSEVNADTYGLEHSEESVKKAEKAGLRMIRGFVEDEQYDIPGAPYDAFYIMNYLEHIPEPVSFLKGIRRNLSEDGIGLVEVPNFDMMLRQNLYSEFIQDHLSYFTEATLKTALELSGFEVLDIRSIWHDYIISAVVRKRKLLDLTPMTRQREKIYNLIHTYIDECESKGYKIAAWGAGHQALATIALLELDKHLEVVLDSADFKQNLYTPGTHLRVVAPGKMTELGINAVIIMAGSYSDEIGRIMDETYPDVEWVILGSDGMRKKNM